MQKQALGLIETVGLLAAIEAADAAAKSANVELIGYELTRGDGMTTVKIRGDVGAVKAAVDSARAAASKVGVVYSSQIIPRPASDTEKMISTSETIGTGKIAATIAAETTTDKTETQAPVKAVEIIDIDIAEADNQSKIKIEVIKQENEKKNTGGKNKKAGGR